MNINPPGIYGLTADYREIERRIFKARAKYEMLRRATWPEKLKRPLVTGGIFNYLLNVSLILFFNAGVLNLSVALVAAGAVAFGVIGYRRWRDRDRLLAMELLVLNG